MRQRCAPHSVPATNANARARNHQRCQNGGVMVMSSVAGSGFHTPRWLAALTRNTYLPGLRLV